MKSINDEQLDKIVGGNTSYISGPIINAFVNIIKLLVDAGNDVGSSIRRVAENKICPMK